MKKIVIVFGLIAVTGAFSVVYYTILQRDACILKESITSFYAKDQSAKVDRELFVTFELQSPLILKKDFPTQIALSKPDSMENESFVSTSDFIEKNPIFPMQEQLLKVLEERSYTLWKRNGKEWLLSIESKSLNDMLQSEFFTFIETEFPLLHPTSTTIQTQKISTETPPKFKTFITIDPETRIITGFVLTTGSEFDLQYGLTGYSILEVQSLYEQIYADDDTDIYKSTLSLENVLVRFSFTQNENQVSSDSEHLLHFLEYYY